jgi:hypothetical protein
MIFTYDDNEVYVSIHLIPEYNIFKRIWNAIKYIFGYKCKYGQFDEFIFDKTDVKKLKKIIEYLEK